MNLTAEALMYGTHYQGISQFYLYNNTFVYVQHEPYLPLPTQPKPILVYQPQNDERLSWPGTTTGEHRTHDH